MDALAEVRGCRTSGPLQRDFGTDATWVSRRVASSEREGARGNLSPRLFTRISRTRNTARYVRLAGTSWKSRGHQVQAVL